MSDAFQKELALLGIESSPAFVRAPEGNGCAERFIRTLRRPCPGCAPSTPSRSSVRRGSGLREIYNTIRPIERHGFETPQPAAKPVFTCGHGPA